MTLSTDVVTHGLAAMVLYVMKTVPDVSVKETGLGAAPGHGYLHLTDGSSYVVGLDDGLVAAAEAVVARMYLNDDEWFGLSEEMKTALVALERALNTRNGAAV